MFLIAVLAAILLSLSTHNGMPFILLVMAVLAIVYTFIANKTVLGRHVYMVGGNPKAAKLSGVRTDLVMLAVYTNMAFLSTIAGFVVAGRLNAASPKAGTGYELDAIAACTIGGAGQCLWYDHGFHHRCDRHGDSEQRHVYSGNWYRHAAGH